jgi:hypothetical protein
MALSAHSTLTRILKARFQRQSTKMSENKGKTINSIALAL